jgi:PPM family protein phosphatase
MHERRDTPEADWRGILSKPLGTSEFQPLSSLVQLEIAGDTHVGKVQTFNSDHYLAIRLGRVQETLATSLAAGDLPPDFEEYGYAMLVADGLGEQGAGVQASRVALSAVAHLAIEYGKWNVRLKPDVTPDIVQQGQFYYRRANDAVMAARKSDRRLASMSTSMTAVYIAGTDLFFAHVGHSRAFVFRDGALVQLTVDHTRRQERQDAREPKPLSESQLDVTHIVTATVGGNAEGPELAIEHVQLWSGDRVLLCTNGLTDAVSDERIADVLALRRRPHDDCQRLIEMALAAGGRDNVTVMVADYGIRPASGHSERVWYSSR